MNYLQSPMKHSNMKMFLHRVLSSAMVLFFLTVNTGLAEDKALPFLSLLLNAGALNFSGNLELTPDVAYIGEEKIITATVAAFGIKKESISVKLVRLDPTEVAVITMLDDGACSSGTCLPDASGDEIEGDGVFTGRFTVNGTSEEMLKYRAVVTQISGGKSIRSEDFEVMITEHLTDTKLNEILAKHSTYQTQLDNAVGAGTVPGTIEAILSQLQSDPEVLQAGKSDGGQGLWIVYEGGVGGVLYAAEPGVKGASSIVDRQGAVFPEKNRLVDYPPYKSYFPKTVNTQSSKCAAKSTAKDTDKIRSNKVRVIAAQYFDWGENDDIPKMKTLLDDTCFDVSYTKYTASGAGSVEDFKDLDDYGIVLISSHGDSFYNGLLSLYKDKFGWDWPFGIVILHSNMKVTTANKITYEDDLKKGRLVLWYGNYGITPDFITKYSTNFPDSMVYMSICRGAWNSSMANAFLNSGAKAYFGYSDYVAVSFCVSHGPPLLEGLLEPDKTIADVFVAGQKETDSDPAEFKHYGSKALSLNINGLQDGSFESGDISQAWTVAGDGRIITKLGSDSPTSESYMAVISTGLGFTTTTGEVSQKICLSDSVSKLIFDWNFFSEEFKEFCDSSYDDAFRVSIIDEETSTETQLFTTSVNALCGNLGALLNTPISFDQGDVWNTGWKNHTVDISAFKGKTVKLKFFATDVGDSIYDTAILIDNVRITEE